jgi:hypothetical protein
MNMTKQNIPSIKFRHTPDSQLAFAELSGDFNPVHLDPVQARRSLFGQIVAHGVHNALRGLEEFFKHQQSENEGVFVVERLGVTFKNPVFLHEDVIVIIDEASTSTVQLTLWCGETSIADIRLKGSFQEPLASEHLLKPVDFIFHPEEKLLSQMDSEEGDIELQGDGGRIGTAFPSCAQALGLDGAVRLLGLTRLVGMRCPGLHSLFSGFDVTFSSERSNEPTHYRVVRADDRISLITLSVDGGGMTGSVTAFMRPPPVKQPDMATVRPHIPDMPFEGMRALVVGGSRGLGEISAKILAAGGGEVAITYLSGKEDAGHVAEDILQNGGACKVIQMDVLQPSAALQALSQEGWLPTHVLYFATPRISIRKSETPVDHFEEVYSGGLIKVIEAIQNISTKSLTLFYPSSVYVVEPPADLVDYGAAKEQGEATAEELAKDYPSLTVIIERLPPLATDQTASLLNVDVAPPLETMARLLTKKLC